jgi:hypothetical protein
VVRNGYYGNYGGGFVYFRRRILGGGETGGETLGKKGSSITVSSIITSNVLSTIMCIVYFKIKGIFG